MDNGTVRPSFEEVFFAIAQEFSKRASCPRAQAGVVLVRDKRLVVTGYNGAPSGEPNCLDAGCLIEDNHCQRALHAEVNAIGWAARKGLSVEGATAYVYLRVKDSSQRGVCKECRKVLTAAGIIEIKEKVEIDNIYTDLINVLSARRKRVHWAENLGPHKWNKEKKEKGERQQCRKSC